MNAPDLPRKLAAEGLGTARDLVEHLNVQVADDSR